MATAESTKAATTGINFFAKNASNLAVLNPINPDTNQGKTLISEVCDALDVDVVLVKNTVTIPITEKSRAVSEKIKAAGGYVEENAETKRFVQTVHGLKFTDGTFIPLSSTLEKEARAVGQKCLVNDAGELVINLLQFVTSPEYGGFPCLRVAKTGQGGISYETEVLMGEALSEN